MPLCGITNFRAPDPTPCEDCHGYVSRFFARLGFEGAGLDELVAGHELRTAERDVAALSDAELETYEHDGMPLGRMVRTSVLWFLLRGSVERDEAWVSATRRFLVAARVMPNVSAS